ncbi:MULTISPECIES: hypothetical protein [unclassified Flavobacterium]|jgi:hypothetical protein|uniref:hypothetical protein n=1 Tax=unclassified Flavobacterium TaxID=196869 RepID=UPI0025C27FD8|nr:MULTISPECIES: hypothetical protein [unclassified Flavobacterium]
MKKTLLLILIIGTYLILNCTSASAQDKCKFYVDKTDELTGKQHKATNVLIKSMAMFSAVSAWGIDFDRMGDDYSLISRLGINTISNENIEESDSLMLKLENGNVITLYSKNRITPKPIISSGKTVATNYVSTYTITYEDFKLLSTLKIIYIRINVGPLSFENEMSEKAIPKLQKAAICILQ